MKKNMFFNKSINEYSRLQAAGVHFLISLVLLLVLLIFLQRFWFPQEHFLYSGGIQGLSILIPVDLVLGPLLTLLIFNPEKNKRELRKDLTLIAIVQIAAILWGLVQLHQVRCFAMVFNDVAFETVHQSDINTQYKKFIEQNKEKPKPALGWFQKMMLYRLPMATTEEEKSKKQLEKTISMFTGEMPHLNYSQYQLIQQHNLLKAETISINNIKNLTEEQIQHLNERMKNNPQLGLFPVNFRYTQGYALFNFKAQRIEEMISIENKAWYQWLIL